MLLPIAGAGSLIPLPVLSQDVPVGVKRLGMVFPGSSSTDPRLLTAFFERLRELGWIEGRNLQVQVRWANGKPDRLGSLMAEVIETKVDVLLTSSTPGAVAARRATNSVPIVAAPMGDPVATGLAASLARPGSNLTGLSTGFGDGFASKWLQLLRESLPKLTTVAVILNPESSLALPLRQELEQSAPTLGIKLRFLEVRSASSLALAIQQAHEGSQALLVLPEPITYEHRSQLTGLALKYRLPGMYANLEFVDAGGLMAYGVDFIDLFRRAAEYVDRILRGARPADLPIEEPTQYQLAVNLKTAELLGVSIPESLLLRANRLIR